VVARHWIATVTGVGAVLLAAPIPSAQAHGTLQSPPSRGMLCGLAASSKLAACKAAAAAGPKGALADWDNLRVPDINGQDRQKIPNGNLCSGGLPEFAGLDLARSDWPTTQVRSGASFTFRYRVTIPHTGIFRLYVTKHGYDPAKPLTWTDLQAKPFLTVTDPSARGGYYTLTGKLPQGRSGRDMIYTIWQTTSTPDTYYSCSDVVFTTRATRATGASAPKAKPSAAPTSSAPTSAAPAAGSPVANVTTPAGRDRSWLMVLGAGAVAVALIIGTGATLAFARRRR
jgi:chitin-binding protein